MKSRRLQREFSKALPLLRGLLADATDDPDRPYRPVILRVSTAKADLELAASAPTAKGNRRPAGAKRTDAEPLYLRLSPAQSPAEEQRARFEKAIVQYRDRYGRKSERIYLQDVGVVEIAYTSSGGVQPPENKVAVVTGAAGAIGYGVCQALLENGCFVAATDLPGRRLKQFVEDLRSAGHDRVCSAGLDVTKRAAVAGAFEKVIRTWGGVDIVIVNAGIALVSRLKQIDLEAFRRRERVNVEGTLLTLQEAATHLAAQGTGGDVVVMSTKNVPCPGAGFGAYSATKAASHQLGRIASLELAEYGIRVNMVAPDAVFSEGPYKSGLWQEVGPGRMRARGLDEKGLQQYYQNRNLLKARVTGRHVGNAVLFFVTRQTPTTGATIPVDGGLPDATPR